MRSFGPDGRHHEKRHPNCCQDLCNQEQEMCVAGDVQNWSKWSNHLMVRFAAPLRAGPTRHHASANHVTSTTWAPGEDCKSPRSNTHHCAWVQWIFNPRRWWHCGNWAAQRTSGQWKRKGRNERTGGRQTRRQTTHAQTCDMDGVWMEWLCTWKHLEPRCECDHMCTVYEKKHVRSVPAYTPRRLQQKRFEHEKNWWTHFQFHSHSFHNDVLEEGCHRLYWSGWIVLIRGVDDFTQDRGVSVPLEWDEMYGLLLQVHPTLHFCSVPLTANCDSLWAGSLRNRSSIPVTCSPWDSTFLSISSTHSKPHSTLFVLRSCHVVRDRECIESQFVKLSSGFAVNQALSAMQYTIPWFLTKQWKHYTFGTVSHNLNNSTTPNSRIISFECVLNELQTLVCFKLAWNASRWRWFSIFFTSSWTLRCSASFTTECDNPWY